MKVRDAMQGAGPTTARATGRGRAARLGAVVRRLRFPTIVAVATAAVVATANAQLVGDERDPNEPTTVDTGFTPLAKNTDDWELVAGASFGAIEVPEKRAAVPFDVDFYTVSFRHAKKGFIGGAKCRDPVAGDELRKLKQAGSDCERVPVIYQFTDNDGEGQILKPIYEPPAEGDIGGYVGAIAWIDSDTALAVGGDGAYPRRELGREGCPPPPNPLGAHCSESDEAYAARDPAGMARAWLYDDGVWRELADLPPDMRGLTALAIHPGGELFEIENEVDEGAVGFAGALGQLWRWSTPEREFVSKVDAASSTAELANAASFRFRVRAITFQVHDSSDGDVAFHPRHDIASVTALTAGCCAKNPAHNFPRRIWSGISNNRAVPGEQWRVADTDKGNDEVGETRPFSYYAIHAGGRPWCCSSIDPPEGPGLTILLSPDGPPPARDSSDYPEPPSWVGPLMTAWSRGDLDDTTSGWCERRDASGCDASPFVTQPEMPVGLRTRGSPTYGGRVSSSVRLVHLDGRWSVGALASGRGAVQDGDTPRTLDSEKPSKLYKLDSYGVNAIDAVGGVGIYWAVGDHGAVLSFGEAVALAPPEPPPTELGQPRPAQLSDRTAYGPFQAPVATALGDLPSLGERPLDQLEEPGFVPASDKPVPPTAISPPWVVMSRDGSAGWASAGGVLYEYEGEVWRPCDPRGIKTQVVEVPGDPECAAVTEPLEVAARVPYENDGPANPGNDDRFEIVALTNWGKAYRYSDSRWREEPPERQRPNVREETHPLSIAFTGPDDGWAVAGRDLYGSLVGGDPEARQAPLIYRFDGTQWVNCNPRSLGNPYGPQPQGVRNRGTPDSRQRCHDRDARLPFGTSEFGVHQPRVTSVGTRVYMYGARQQAGSTQFGVGAAPPVPMVIYRDAAKPCEPDAAQRDGCWRSADGGFDPACGARDATGYCTTAPGETPEAGRVRALALADRGDGRGEGFGVLQDPGTGALISAGFAVEGGFVRRAEPQGSPGADYGFSHEPAANVAIPASPPRYLALGPTSTADTGPTGPLLKFDSRRSRWELEPLPTFLGAARALAPDQRGGFWVVADTVPGVYFYRHTSHARREAFEEVAHPIREPITAVAGGLDGSFWVATASNIIYRYDRHTGWERTVINGWNRASVVTAGVGVNALAVGADGRGVAVGDGGRIAKLDPRGVVLDAAAGKVCDSVEMPPCGTSRSLRAAAVAPDGSAVVAGSGRALLWRPASGEFRPVPKPFLAHAAAITGVALPTRERAYLATSTGEIFRGDLPAGDADGNWSWTLENRTAAGEYVTRVNARKVIALEQIAVDEQGRGYAIGEGTVFQRVPDRPDPWIRLNPGFHAETLALPADGSASAFGGPGGLVMRHRNGRFDLVRPADPAAPQSFRELGGATRRARTVGIALLPGTREGELEAWVALSTGVVLHYAPPAASTVLSPSRRAEPLPDSPPPRDGEVSFAVFGKSDCSATEQEHVCRALVHRTTIAGRIADAIADHRRKPGGPQFALFTGDSANAAGKDGTATKLPIDDSIVHARWRELIAEWLASKDVPVFGAIGQRDLSTTEVCPPPGLCHGTRRIGNTGPNLAWRRAMATMPRPWGTADPARTSDLEFRPVVGGSGVEQPAADDVVVDDPDPTGRLGWVVPPRTVSTSAAGRTHYALDVVPTRGDPGGDKPLARIVVLDTSLRSLAATDPLQNPVEPNGGQAGWLEEMLCFAGGDLDRHDPTRECSRQPGQPAIVLTNTPTYSYGPGATEPSEDSGTQAFLNPTGVAGDTQADGAALEALLLRHRASILVTGRIGWNGLYWATAPGLHEPCPGDDYQTEPPEPGTRLCGRSSEDLPVDPASSAGSATSLLAGVLGGVGAPTGEPLTDRATPDSGLTGVLPAVIASSAGRLGGRGEDGTARDGYWRGYTVVRLAPGGDPRETLVEQRPVFDWIGMTATEHTLRPGQRLRLRGYGREALIMHFGRDADRFRVRYADIDSPAITHRYDLVLADPEEPWLPLEDANGDYVPVPAQIATVDRQTGRVRTGKGAAERTYAIAVLSVGDKAATWPLVFEPRRSFAAQRAGVQLPAPPRAARAPAAQPPIRLGEAFPPPPAAPPATPGSALASQTLQPPQPPQLPALPAIGASPPPPAPTLQPPPLPPAPPPPPSVPAQQQPQPLALGAKLQAVSIVPSVNPPAPPPVNPAPPAGSAARKEAKQRQAATAKSEESGGEKSAAESGVDLAADASRPPGSAMTRIEHPFRRVEHAGQPSAWARGALYGGGLAVAALLLATAWGAGRPTPRPRRRDRAAPARTTVSRSWE